MISIKQIGLLSRFSTAILLSALAVGCGDDDPNDMGDEELEVISRVTLTLTPVAGGADVTAVFNDPDGSGMMSTVGTLNLTTSSTYTMSIVLENALETPVEDITEEIRAEAEDHQFFFLGSAVMTSLVQVEYGDSESTYNLMQMGPDLPVGLTSTVTTSSTAGTGVLNIILAHQPGLKTATSNESVGDQDFNIDFPVVITQ